MLLVLVSLRQLQDFRSSVPGAWGRYIYIYLTTWKIFVTYVAGSLLSPQIISDATLEEKEKPSYEKCFHLLQTLYTCFWASIFHFSPVTRRKAGILSYGLCSLSCDLDPSSSFRLWCLKNGLSLFSNHSCNLSLYAWSFPPAFTYLKVSLVFKSSSPNHILFQLPPLLKSRNLVLLSVSIF